MHMSRRGLLWLNIPAPPNLTVFAAISISIREGDAYAEAQHSGDSSVGWWSRRVEDRFFKSASVQRLTFPKC